MTRSFKLIQIKIFLRKKMWFQSDIGKIEKKDNKKQEKKLNNNIEIHTSNEHVHLYLRFGWKNIN